MARHVDINPSKMVDGVNYKNKIQVELSNVENVLDKLSTIMDVTDYQEELNIIKSEICNGSVLDFDKIPDDKLRMGIDKLEKFYSRIQKEAMPYYYANELQKGINEKLEDKEQGIIEVIDNSRELINKLNGLDNNKDRNDLQEINDHCIETLYKVIIKEQIYERTIIIEEILNNSANEKIKERLIPYIIQDLKSIKKKNLITEKIDDINAGLNYDIFTAIVIDTIIENKYQEEKDEYYNRKEEARSDLKKRIFDYQQDVNTLKTETKSLKTSIRNLKADRRINRAKLMSYVLVPVIALSSGYFIGLGLSNRVDEYRTITRTVNPDTKQVVETISDIYDERETTHTSTIKVYGPWVKNSNGYTRSVTAYASDNFTSKEDVDKLMEKYHYTESKESLSSNDSTEESTVLITETIQDKNDSRKSTKYILPFTIGAGVLAAVIDFLIAYNMGTYEIQCELKKLKERLKEKERDKENLKEERNGLKIDGDNIAHACETNSNIYFFSPDEFSELKIIKKTL